MTGRTRSSDFPTTPGAFETGFHGNYDAFVVKVNPAGSGLDYATFLGGVDERLRRQHRHRPSTESAGTPIAGTGDRVQPTSPPRPVAFDYEP